MSPLQRPDS